MSASEGNHRHPPKGESVQGWLLGDEQPGR
jgi:hypothetical protein